MSFGCNPIEKHKNIIYGGGWWPPFEFDSVSLMSPKQAYDPKFVPFALTTYIVQHMDVTCP